MKITIITEKRRCLDKINTEYGFITYVNWCRLERDRINESGGRCYINFDGGECFLTINEGY